MFKERNIMKVSLRILLISFALAVMGCAERHKTETQSVTGTFSGVTGNGESVVLTLEQGEYGSRGQGTINGKPLVISGINTYGVSGTIMYADGSSSLVKLGVDPVSEGLTIKLLDQPKITLNDGGTPVTRTPGPFTGTYRPVGSESNHATATIIQSGSLIMGNAEIYDQATSVTGRATEPNKVVGTITYRDESQVFFEAELSADKKTITLSGMGKPIVLDKF